MSLFSVHLPPSHSHTPFPLIDLISTLLSLSTTTLPFRTLTTSLTQLNVYFTKFKNRLNTQHSLHLKRLIGLLEALVKYAEEWRGQRVGSKENGEKKEKLPMVEVVTSGELLVRLGRKADGINLLEVERYLRDSKVSSSCPLLTYATTAPASRIRKLNVDEKWFILFRLRGRYLGIVRRRWRKLWVKVSAVSMS